MLFFMDFGLQGQPKGLSLDQLRDEWEKEAEATLRAIGKRARSWGSTKSLDSGALSGVLNVKFTDELDQTVMARLPIAHHLEIAEILPLHEYSAFAEDLRQRWSTVTS